MRMCNIVAWSYFFTPYKDILDNCMLPTFWQQFEEGLFLFQHDNVHVKKSKGHEDMA